MNTIKIYLSSSGSLAELKKDFPLYQGAFNDKLLNVYVPTSLLPGTVDTQYVDETGFVHTEPGVFTALKIGMVSIGRDGRVNKTNAYYMRYLKKLVYQGIEYALYERALPQAFTLFEGQNSQAPKLIINVVNMENNNEYNGEEIILGEPKILQVITSQQCSLDVLPSTSFDRDALIEPSEWEIVNGKIDDLYEKYDYIVNNIDETIANYTYSKAVIDQKDADALQLAKDYADENFYNETESDARFVHLTGSETIGGTKTFTDSPIVPNASADMHATNREDLQNYTYSKAEIGNLTQPISFETEQNFYNWLAGEYVRPDGIFPQDLLLGKKVIIKETGKNNYQVAYVPALSIECYKILVEDTKALEEIIARPYKNITATDGQEFVEDLKDEIDLKTQTVNLGILTIEPNEWQIDGDKFSYEYTNENYTDSLTQSLKFINNTVSQAEQIIDEGIVFLGFEDTTDGVKLIINKEPSFNLSFDVMLLTYTDITITPEELAASMVGFDNTGTGLSAVNVQQALNEVKGLIDDNAEEIESKLELESATPRIVGGVLLTSVTPRRAYVDGNDKPFSQLVSMGTVLSSPETVHKGISWQEIDDSEDLIFEKLFTDSTTLIVRGDAGISYANRVLKVPSHKAIYDEDLDEYAVYPITSYNGGINVASGIILPETIYNIGDSAFYNNQNIQNLKATILVTGSNALRNSALMQGNKEFLKIREIGGGAMADNTDLISLKLGKDLKSIATFAFVGCSSLEYIEILAEEPPSLANTNAFNDTNNCPIRVPIGSLTLYNTNPQWSSLSGRLEGV